MKGQTGDYIFEKSLARGSARLFSLFPFQAVSPESNTLGAEVWVLALRLQGLAIPRTLKQSGGQK